MKKTLLVTILAFIVLTTISCRNASRSDEFMHTPSDTVSSVAMFIVENNQIKVDYVIKIKIDTLKPNIIDSSKNVWVRDSVYFIPYQDTIMGPDKKPMFDSLSGVKTETKWYLFDKRYIIQDFNFDLKKMITLIR